MLIDEGLRLEEVFDRIWREINQGANHSAHPFRFVILGTRNHEDPSLRYVVLREVNERLELFVYSDVRTTKVNELTNYSTVALLFYDPQERVQIRIKGQATLHHQDQITSRHWKRVPAESKKAYGSYLTPGSTVMSPGEAHHWPDTIDERNFAVVRIRPSSIDVLQIRGMAHVRAQFSLKETGWKGEWVVP